MIATVRRRARSGSASRGSAARCANISRSAIPTTRRCARLRRRRSRLSTWPAARSTIAAHASCSKHSRARWKRTSIPRGASLRSSASSISRPEGQRGQTGTMGRKRAVSWRMRMAALALLLALGAGGWAWWQAQHWAPPRGEYPVQGALIGASDGPVSFRALRAIGAEFVYLEASEGADGRDARFAENLVRVRDSGVRFGAVHAYDPCVPAERQAAN